MSIMFSRFTRSGVVLLRRSFTVQNGASSSSLRKDILEASIKNVPALGWTQDSIAKAVMELGLPAHTHRVLSRGPVEVVEYFIEQKRDYAKERVAELRTQYHKAEASTKSEDPDISNMNDDHDHYDSHREVSADEVLHTAIEAHIDYMAPYVHTWPSALALFADPSQASAAMSTGLQIADDIVTFGGVEASRGDWYTERLLAIMLYSSTEMYMLTDTSPDFADTR